MTSAAPFTLPHVVILTAGGAGMFCGSCMHDNTWARVLQGDGFDISLVPAYTPIRVDEENLSSSRVVFGGINIYLNSRWRWWSRLPNAWKRWLDRPSVIRWLTRWSLSTEASELGHLTFEMLSGETGSQRQAIEELASYFADLHPDVVLFTNALLSGALPRLKQRCPAARMLCILQGDDIFLEALAEPWKSRVLEVIRQRAQEFDGFVVHSEYYRDFMADYLRVPPDRFHQIPLTIDCQKHTGQPKAELSPIPVVGYFARVCEEKGLHQLVEACVVLKARGVRVRLRAGGYLAPDRKGYFESVCRLAAPLGSDFEYIGSPAEHAEKVEFLNSLDLFSVPTVYQEPKGLYVLEALANGVPVILPSHGAFPELIRSTQGGLLHTPGDPQRLADCLEQLIGDSGLWRKLAAEGQQNVRASHDFSTLAVASRALFGVSRSGELRQNPPMK